VEGGSGDEVPRLKMDRRTFVYNAALGTLHLGWGPREFGGAGLAPAQEPSALASLKIGVHAPAFVPSKLAMPGLFPGRVVEVFHPEAIRDRRISEPAVRTMLTEGMAALISDRTGDRTPADAWARFVAPTDVVAVKVNPSSAPATVTSIALLREVIRSLTAVGVPARNIIVYDRNSNQLEVNGYHTAVPAGVRVVGLDQRWSVKGATAVTQAGYDPEVYCEMDCFGERETRSYLASIVTREADKIINLPCLKEHNASGVTGCLKNLAYGSFNNVARTHVDPKTYTDPVIPVMCSVGPLRAKSVLHIMDGIRAVYHGGPFGWNPEFVWEARTLLIGTDPVAMDRIELEIVEQKRREVGAPSLFDRNPANLGRSSDIERTAQKNPFYREPNHIKTAAQLGLGTWELDKIDRRRIDLGPARA
jgi:uncharacterized protein (DUF362 family)